MCGISAYVGKQNPDAMKLRLLLMYNESRGGDASGVFINNEIIKDGIKHKKAPEFLANNDIAYNPEVENKIFITHNRKGTVGSNTTENAHPHIIDDDFVLVQNGTIKNIWELCNKYKIEHKDITNDSKALALLLDKVGYQVLNEYVGFAALIFTRISEPNVLYVFKGASPTYINGKLEEERPLFYLYNENTNEMFFSSIADSLYAINNNEGFAIPVKSNYVYRIDFTGEKIKMRAIFKSNRGITGVNHGVNTFGNAFKGSSSYAGRSTYSQSFYERHRWDSQYDDCYIPPKKETTIPSTSTVTKSQASVKEEKNRYYTSYDKLLFVDQIVSVKDTRYVCNKKLMHGQFHITDSGIVKEKPVDKLTKIYYFVYGVMIDNSVNYNLLTRETKHEKAEPNSNFAFFMSNFSRYPVLHSEKDVSDVEKILYYKGKIVKDCYARMVFSDKIMMVKNYIIETVTIISTKNMWSNSERAILCGSKTNNDLTITKSEEYTKESYNRVRSLEKKNLYLPPKQDVQIQQSINFSVLNKKTPNIFDVIPELDSIYDTPKEFYDTMPIESMICLHLFIEEHFSEEETMTVEDINESIFLILLDAIERQCTLRELIQENTIMIESFSSAAYIEFEDLKVNNTISGLKEKYGYNLEEKLSRPQERTVYDVSNKVKGTEEEVYHNESFEEEEEEDPTETAEDTFDYVVIDMMDALETIDAGEKEIEVIENVSEKYMGLKLVAKKVKEFFNNELMNFFDSYQEKEKKEILVNKQEKMNA